MKLIVRGAYLSEINSLLNTLDIKVITGIRRSGKSKLLESFVTNILKNDENSNIIHINFNLTEFENLLEYHALEKYVESCYIQGKNNYLLIDEIQMCTSFEKAINSLHAKEKYDIYISGSNAFLQSSDLATLFVGRTYEIHILPFSFKEYLDYYPSLNIYNSLNNYIKDGGMAGSYVYKNETQKYRYLNNDVLNALIVRDIIDKHHLKNELLLQELIDFLMDNIGNIASIRKISNIISSNVNNDHKIVGRYITLLCRSFAFYRVRRYDIKGKKYLHSEDKYYLADHSFRYARLGTKNMDFGRILENIVAIELLRRGYEVYVGVLYKKEIDFVAIKQGEKMYIQVANDISSSKTFEREISPLFSINDGYLKMIITRIYQPAYQYEGIKIIDVADWLIDN